MAEKHLIKTEDLGGDRFANAWSDGSFTIRNGEQGVRIDLTRAEADRLLELMAANAPSGAA